MDNLQQSTYLEYVQTVYRVLQKESADSICLACKLVITQTSVFFFK